MENYDTSWCANCGLKITLTNIADASVWSSNRGQDLSVHGDKDEYFGFCPGSRENLEKYPTFTDWRNKGLKGYPVDDNISHSHRPIDSLVRLVIETGDNHGQ